MSERDMAALLELVARHLGTEWGGVIDWLRDHNSLDDIEARLRDGDMRGLVQAIDDAALKFAAETNAAYVHSAQEASSWLNAELPDVLVRFDVNNTAAIAAAQRNQVEWVTGLRQEARETIHQVIVDGHQRGANPIESRISRATSIGLTPNQESAVRSYRAALENQDWSNALGRELSSGHSDRTITAARSADKALTQQQVDLAVERYRQSHVAARAEAIARTESLKNVHAGVSAAFDQAIARGDVDADQLEKTWNHAGRGRYSRPDHVAVDGMKVGYDETFTVGGISMRYPGDPSAPVEQVVNCRCTFSTTIR
jgi:hypothetical protein